MPIYCDDFHRVEINNFIIILIVDGSQSGELLRLFAKQAISHDQNVEIEIISVLIHQAQTRRIFKKLQRLIEHNKL